MKNDTDMYMLIAGYRILVVFEKTQSPLLNFFRKNLIRSVSYYYKGFITENEKMKVDFTLTVTEKHKPRLVQIEKPYVQNRVFLDLARQKRNNLFLNYHVSYFQFGHLLQFALKRLLMRNGGIFHASSCLINGCVYVFFAPSGGGKSTIIRLLQSRAFVNTFSDEFIILKQNRKDVVAYQTPLIEKYKKRKSVHGVKVKACFFLKKSPATVTCKRIKPDVIIPSLMPQSYFDQSGIMQQMRFLRKLAEYVPFHTLSFSKKRTYVKNLYASITQLY
ncbi:MAG: hypothetical protein WC489_05435 [Patescibacteria group bacterium]